MTQFKNFLKIDDDLSITTNSNTIHCDVLSSCLNENELTFCLDEKRLIHFPELRDEWMPEFEPLSDKIVSEQNVSKKPLKKIDSPPSLHTHCYGLKTLMAASLPLDQDRNNNVQPTHPDYRHLLLKELSSVVKRLVLEYHSLETKVVSPGSLEELATLSKSPDKSFIREESNKSQGTLLYIYSLLERIFSHGFRCKSQE